MDYETILRKVFPVLYEAAIALCGDEEEAALLAQASMLHFYREAS